MSPASSYGVHEQDAAADALDFAAECIRRFGYAVVDGGWRSADLERFSTAYDATAVAHATASGGLSRLTTLNEHDTIRCPMFYDRTFLEVACNPNVLELCRRLIGPFVVLNQQNGVTNPANRRTYNQGAYHRDLPYQHFTSSRPLALNALLCLDPFTVENGATWVIPASHLQEAYPSDAMLAPAGRAVPAPAGSFIVLDCMAYHRGGTNQTALPRRAVNHIYAIPFLRQQIDLPKTLGPAFSHDPTVRRLLGYDTASAWSISDFLASREPNQS